MALMSFKENKIARNMRYIHIIRRCHWHANDQEDLDSSLFVMEIIYNDQNMHKHNTVIINYAKKIVR